MYLCVFTPQAISRLLHVFLHVGLPLFCQIFWLRLVSSGGLLSERCVTSVQGISLSNQNYKSVLVKDMFVCYFMCKEDPVCQSINFYKDRNICELNNRTLSVRLSKTESDSNAFYMDNPFRGKLKQKFQQQKQFILFFPFMKDFYPSLCIGLY